MANSDFKINKYRHYFRKMGPYPNKYLRGSNNDDETLTWEDSSQFTLTSNNPLAYSMNPDYLSAADQQAFFRNAKRTVDEMSGAGQGDDVDRATVGMPAATLIAGRGGELGLLSRGYQKKSTLKIPMGNAKLHNAFAEQLKAWEPVLCKMQFAYKAVLPVVHAINSVPTTRFYTHQFFRHHMPGVNSSTYAHTTTQWHNTLGPDDSLIRQVPPSGSAYYSIPAGYNTSLRSAYRYPSVGDWQAIRMSRIILENVGWAANPMKHIGMSPQTTGGVGTTPVAYQVYANPSPGVVDGVASAVSYPAGQTTDMGIATPAANLSSCYYRSQFGVGNVSYQFCNDGNSPVVCDIVITKLQKGHKCSSASGYTTALENAFKQGYMNMCLGNKGVMDFDGTQPTNTDIFLNSKVEFMPQKALKYYDSTGNANVPHNIAYVARDQFIIDAGSIKPYSFNLPALNYDAREYEPTGNHIDDLTYCVSVAFSTTPIPLFETGTGSVSIIDRRGASVNVSVTGVYAEKAHPVYLAEYNNHMYLNSYLVPPYYGTGPPALATSVILAPETAQRGTTVSSSYAEYGVTNSQKGA